MGHDQDKGSDLPYPIAPQALWILSAKLAGPGSTILSAEAKFSISVHLTGLDGLASDGTAALIFSQCQKTWLETWSREPQFRYYCLVISDHSFTVLDYFSNFSIFLQQVFAVFCKFCSRNDCFAKLHKKCIVLQIDFLQGFCNTVLQIRW